MQLEDGYPKIEQQLLLLPDDQGEDKLLWGHEVTEHIRLHPEDSLRVIDNLKLALCPEYADHDAVQHIRGILGCPPGEAAIGNFRRLYTLILKKAWAGCVGFYNRISDVDFAKPAEYWTTIATEVKITIPAMWDEDARSVMTQAAADAGFPDCRLYLEPLCAAAAEMTKLQAAGNLQYGDTMLLIDIGYFTIDFALARIDAPSPSTKQPTMVAVGVPAGQALGCHIVHTLAWKKGGIKRCRALLGDLPETSMRQQFFRYIEDNMKQPHHRDFPILIDAIDKLKARCTRSLTFLFPGDVLKNCLTTWASRITVSTVSFTQGEQFQHLSVHYGHLTGGRSQNAFVLAKLKTTLASMRIDVRKPDSAEADMAVARGGLEQYPRNEADVLPEGYFYVTWDEPCHQNRHKDIQMKWTPDPSKRTRNLHATKTLTPHLATSSLENPGK
ncbi:putative ATPase, nucleotide binding domain-containing protein [Septoria linicola]|nr:putative ATPase, nucleotide binding domain-containing protein [Septoria linicola]